jgi:uncharacterized membrane protein
MTSTPRPHQFDLIDAAATTLVVAQLALASYVARYGPTGPIPVHFGLNGEPNRWGNRAEVAIMIAVLAAATAATTYTVDLARARRTEDGLQRTMAIGRTIGVAVPGAITVMFAAMALDPGAAATAGGQRLMLSLVWLVFIFIGAVMGKAAPNPFLGVRVYWTLRSRLAWDKSNRLLGRIYFLGGLIGLLAMPFVELGRSISLVLIWAMIVGIGGGLAAILESWLVWRRDPERLA